MSDRRPVAVVTGAGRGIGRAIALAFAGAGGDVVLAGRDPSTLEATAEVAAGAGAATLCVRTDVTSEGEVSALATAASERFGAVDTVVPNSGVGGPSGPLWELDRAGWDETFAVNVTGVFLTARAFLPAMLDRRRGSIVVLGSMTGKRPLWGRSPYAASKLALVGLVRTLALETAGRGVRVNLVSPGPVEGDRMDWVFRAQAKGRGITPEEARAEMVTQLPIGRLVEADEVASAVLSLASGELSAVTGVDLNVSGGMVMY
ncbi:MAG TPA: SDR family NAD(P)-dependent oxidoreductase [Actinomycetota bacterium]|nr:SDR family NAD(P)-dependent oxidoreductase [Actinomycetota bacterium]